MYAEPKAPWYVSAAVMAGGSAIGWGIIIYAVLRFIQH